MNKDLIVSTAPKSVFSESIRTLRTNLQFTFMRNKKNVIMITSSIEGEGKSFVSSNLSLAFAAANTKVLLIDCDLRKGRHSTIFNIKDRKGLSDLLLDDADNYKDYIVQTEHKNLYVMPKGTTPPNPSELLGSLSFRELIKGLKKSYDLIILDCPPLTYVTDALVISSTVDEAVLVCSSKKTPMDVLIESKKALESANVKIAGVVLNNESKDGKNYYYSKYYK